MVLARKRFGQHFLEPAWVDTVVHAIDPQPDEIFVEIGPGRGALTRPLATRAKIVIAYEIDRDLAAELRNASLPNLTVIEGDFLTTADQELTAKDQGPRTKDQGLRIAGNLPYNVASPILFKLVELYSRGVPLRDATVMLQREVADRLAAEPGSRTYGVLSVLIRHAASVERLLTLPSGAFRPPPKVQSALVRLRLHPPDPPVKDPVVFSSLVQAVFTRRRKTLANALLAFQGGRRGDGGGTTESPPSPADLLARAGLDGKRRPETLTIAEFARLADAYAAAGAVL